MWCMHVVFAMLPPLLQAAKRRTTSSCRKCSVSVWAQGVKVMISSGMRGVDMGLVTSMALGESFFPSAA